MTSNTLHQSIKQGQKAMENRILRDLSTKIKEARQMNKNRLPHGFTNTIVNKTQTLLPWIKYNTIINFCRKQAKRATIIKSENGCVLSSWWI